MADFRLTASIAVNTAASAAVNPNVDHADRSSHFWTGHTPDNNFISAAVVAPPEARLIAYDRQNNAPVL